VAQVKVLFGVGNCTDCIEWFGVSWGWLVDWQS